MQRTVSLGGWSILEGTGSAPTLRQPVNMYVKSHVYLNGYDFPSGISAGAPPSTQTWR